MKIYISADMEGITGANSWNEVNKDHAEYGELREQLTAEVVAACEGALAAGATELLVKDAHWTGRNIIAARLPREARLIRGWTVEPLSNMGGLDRSCSAVVLVGYHSAAGAGTSPLAHTENTSIDRIRINDRYASELLINAYTAAWCRVPVVFLSGDEGVAREATEVVPGITTVAVLEGSGGATTSIHPALAVERIRSGVEKALRGDLARCQVPLPRRFEVEVRFRAHERACKASFYPHARLIEPHTARFEAEDLYEVLRFFMFTVTEP